MMRYGKRMVGNASCAFVIGGSIGEAVVLEGPEAAG